MGRRSALADISIKDLQKEISRRGSRATSLERKRDKMMAKIDAMNAQIRQHGGSRGGGAAGGGRGGRGRARNASNLVESLQKVLTDKTMSVSDVTEAVQKAGYSTTSPNFRTIVNQALISSGKFKRMGRGQYTVKGS